jgi:hypothetical protein
MDLCDRLQANLTIGGDARDRLLECLLHESLEPTAKVPEAAE